MCSTEEDSALLHRSREAGLAESGAEVEFVVESVVLGEKEVGVWMTTKMRVERLMVLELRLLLVVVSVKKMSLRMRVLASLMRTIVLRSVHSTGSEERHDLDYLARKEGILSRN